MHNNSSPLYGRRHPLCQECLSRSCPQTVLRMYNSRNHIGGRGNGWGETRCRGICVRAKWVCSRRELSLSRGLYNTATDLVRQQIVLGVNAHALSQCINKPGGRSEIWASKGSDVLRSPSISIKVNHHIEYLHYFLYLVLSTSTPLDAFLTRYKPLSRCLCLSNLTWTSI